MDERAPWKNQRGDARGRRRLQLPCRHLEASTLVDAAARLRMALPSPKGATIPLAPIPLHEYYVHHIDVSATANLMRPFLKVGGVKRR